MICITILIYLISTSKTTRLGVTTKYTNQNAIKQENTCIHTANYAKMLIIIINGKGAPFTIPRYLRDGVARKMAKDSQALIQPMMTLNGHSHLTVKMVTKVS